MSFEKDKLIKAKEILLKMANGVNPVNGQKIEEESFLNDPRMIRCLFYISEVLDNNINGKFDIPKPEKFVITPEQKAKVEFPDRSIGVNEIAKCINNVLDVYESKKITGLEISKRLKIMGILSEKSTDGGKTQTVTNGKSMDYGFEMVRVNFNGNEYDKVVANEKGKKYILENIEKIMAVELTPGGDFHKAPRG